MKDFYKNKRSFDVRNLIIKTFLIDQKRQSPHLFLRPEVFHKKFQKIIIDYLDDAQTTVFLATGDEINTYGGPFTLRNDIKTKGYCIISKNKNTLVSLFSSFGYEDEFIKETLLDRALSYLQTPGPIFIPHPTPRMWDVVRYKAKEKDFKIRFPWGDY